MFQDITTGPGASTYSSHTMEILIMLLVAFLLGLLLGYLLWYRYRKLHAELEGENGRMSAKLTDLEKDHASLKYQHDELDKDNKAHRSKIRILEADVSILQGKLDRMAAAEESHVANPLVGAVVDPDDLKKIEGIGPKIEELLNAAGIHTWRQLSKCKVEDIKKVLSDGGSRYNRHDPTTWAKQAGMAAEGNWDELKKYQDYLDGGKNPG
ncbi:MAG: hypothetical protein NXI23_11700 [Bacteroidetes bacterium]|jgi:predicted flap endonuclease-1-like 5' DNA nuclease|nr:hypothetical protein [Bacteroidota bacterium]